VRSTLPVEEIRKIAEGLAVAEEATWLETWQAAGGR
jgi:hypothetical protein